ncbi:hypothetical protein ACEPPN_012107 [Leptodophora sp. 'Broadleaf-Isolate-01']
MPAEHNNAPPMEEHGRVSKAPGAIARQQMLLEAQRIRNTTKFDKRNTYTYKNIDYDNEIRVWRQRVADPLSYFWRVEEPENKIYFVETEEAYDGWIATGKLSILLRINMIGCLLIRNNLKDALETLRSTSESIFLWVDAVCINQSCIPERPTQVARMHDVYTQAETVYIWLGIGEDEENKKTLRFLTKVLDLFELEQLITRLEEKGDNKRWLEDKLDYKRAIAIMRSKWFSRRWVI